MEDIITPYKRKELVNLLVPDNVAESIKSDALNIPSITLSQRQQCDLEILLNGGLTPLTGFMNENDYKSVISHARLSDGTLWPIPYCLDVNESVADNLKVGAKLALRDHEGFMQAVLNIESIWKPDKKLEANAVYGTEDRSHPGVNYLFENVNNIYVGGLIEGLQLPYHYDFETLRDTPLELRKLFDKQGWRNVVAFHTSKPMHRVHHEITMRAARMSNAHILLHPVVGMSKPGDIHYYARVHCYQAIKKYYPKGLVALSLLPVALRMAGPREALMNAIIRQNYGCSHYIIGTEHSSPPNVRDSSPRFYQSGSSQEYVMKFQNEIDIQIIPMEELVYDESNHRFISKKTAESNNNNCNIYTNRMILDAISKNEEIPAWATYPEVIDELSKINPPRNKQGFTLFFTGLSGSGKSTLAKIIYGKFLEEGKRPVTLLDGDIVRHYLSSELGFSKQDRYTNINRIGFVASEITKNRGVAICAPIAPYTDMRRAVRDNIERYGGFIEIHVATPLEECERRDRKGLYIKARKGIIPEFTGISDPYEVPENPEIRIDTQDKTPIQAAQEIYIYLVNEGYID